MYWPVYFAQWNPVVFRNILTMNRHQHVEFQNSVIQNGEMYFNIDNRLKSYFLSLPSDCPYLFPWKMRKGQWLTLPVNYRKQWLDVKKEAGTTSPTSSNLCRSTLQERWRNSRLAGDEQTILSGIRQMIRSRK